MTTMGRWVCGAIVVSVCVLAGAGHVEGQESPGRTVEFLSGPVVSSSRVIGLGGAFIGVAEGADGHLINPASIAVRAPHTLGDWFDWDFALSWASFSGSDEVAVELSTVEGAYRDALLLDAGFNLKFGHHGGALHVYTHSFTLRPPQGSGQDDVTLDVATVGVGYAWGALDGQLALGAVLLPVGLSLTELGAAESLLDISGVSGLIGGLWAPHAWPLRVGLTFRTPTSADATEGRAPAWLSRVRPVDLVVPWQVGVGASVKLFAESAYNRPSRWSPRRMESMHGLPPDASADVLPERAEPEEDGPTLLVAADLLVMGPSDDAVSLSGVLAQVPEAAGESASVALRLGVESELVPGWWRVRAGSYLEPSRVSGRSPRLHGTAGTDVRVPLWLDWRVNAMVDGADAYFNWGVGVGLWH